jgi:D-3-phosphoglycerate dehydrogenase
MTRPTVWLSFGPTARAEYYGARALADLQAVATVVLNGSDAPSTADSIAEAAAGCDVVVSDRSAAAPATLLARLPRLVAWCRCAVDLRNVHTAAASAHGILVTRASAGFTASVSEWIVGAMIDLSRHLSDSVLQYRAGIVPAATMGRELRGATLGIVGYGAIARRLAPVASALGMRVVAHDPHAAVDDGPEAVPLAALLAAADYVVCLAAATPQTENLMDDAAFAAMKPGAYFVNASRGDLVDDAALRRALDSGRLAGCALDVGRAPDQKPDPALARHPRVIATPHVGGLTVPAVEHQSMETVRQVAEIAAGRVPPGAVNGADARRLQGFAQRARLTTGR